MPPASAAAQSDLMNFSTLYQAPPVERIQMARKGVSASDAKQVIAILWDTREAAYDALNISAATINRKAKNRQTLDVDDSERIVGVAKLIGQVQAMVAESGEVEGFDAAAWLARWIKEPLPALGGLPPVEFLDTMEGQGLVASALARIQSGAYA